MKNWGAILFDVDGTLYHQTWLRVIMMRRLVVWSLSQPSLGYRTLSALRAYRKAQEKLRNSGERHADLAQAQLNEALRTTQVTEQFLRMAVARWIESEPLTTLVKVRRRGLLACLQRLKSNRILLGVVSDYPARPKLKALGVEDLIDVVVSAQDTNVGELKPSPRGLLVALRLLGVSAEETVYVGDRIDVDAGAARRAGVDSLIFGRRRSTTEHPYRCISDFQDLADIVLGESAVT